MTGHEKGNRIYRKDKKRYNVEPLTLIFHEDNMDDSDIAKYTEQAFKMYGGLVTDVTIEFEDSLMGAVRDKFGEHVHIVRTSPENVLPLFNCR